MSKEGSSRASITEPEKSVPHKENWTGRLTTFAGVLLQWISPTLYLLASKEPPRVEREETKKLEENRENKPPSTCVAGLMNIRLLVKYSMSGSFSNRA